MEYGRFGPGKPTMLTFARDFAKPGSCAQLPFHRSLASEPHNNPAGASWFEMISSRALVPSPLDTV